MHATVFCLPVSDLLLVGACRFILLWVWLALEQRVWSRKIIATLFEIIRKQKYENRERSEKQKGNERKHNEEKNEK